MDSSALVAGLPDEMASLADCGQSVLNREGASGTASSCSRCSWARRGDLVFPDFQTTGLYLASETRTGLMFPWVYLQVRI